MVQPNYKLCLQLCIISKSKISPFYNLSENLQASVPRQSSSLENDVLAVLLPCHTLPNHSLEELLEPRACPRRQLVAVLPVLLLQQQHAIGRVVPVDD
jgi:hypothetical protein